MKATLHALIAQGIDALRNAGTLPANTDSPDFVIERPRTEASLPKRDIQKAWLSTAPPGQPR